MFIILLLFALTSTLQGIPLSSPADAPNNLPILDLRGTQNHFGERSVSDIIISCFATIFACTWSAIHPNVPAPADCWWTRFKRQVTIMICALLAPEFLTAWALRQRMGAKQIMEEYNEKILGDTDGSGGASSILDTIRGLFQDSPMPVASAKGPRWTLSHGFFLQMGGFMLSDCGAPVHVLLNSTYQVPGPGIPKEMQLINNIQEGIIDPPRITEEDIQDRSKGDAISKTVIILQTTWFIVQCIARWAQHLPVTELEVVTLGFAMLNGMTYALWWHKPQNAQRPVFLERKKSQGISIDNPIAVNAVTVSGSKTSNENLAEGSKASEKEEKEISPQPAAGKDSWFKTAWRKIIEEKKIWVLPIILIMVVLRPLAKMMGFTHQIVRIEDHRVATFYTAHSSSSGAAILLSFVVIGIPFGLVHLIPSWFLVYSTHQEMWLWRVSAIIVTAVPLLYLLTAGLVGVAEFLDKRRLTIIAVLIYVPCSISLVFCVLAYPIARIFLLVLSLISLRSLAPGALQTIEWVTFIPHL